MKAIILRALWEHNEYPPCDFDAFILPITEEVLRAMKRLDHQHNDVLKRIDLPDLCGLKTHFNHECFLVSSYAIMDCDSEVILITDTHADDLMDNGRVVTSTFDPKALEKAYRDGIIPKPWIDHCFLVSSRWTPPSDTPVHLHFEGWPKAADETFRTVSLTVETIEALLREEDDE